MSDQQTLFRHLPKVDELLASEELADLAPRPLLLMAIRRCLDDLRQKISQKAVDMSPEEIQPYLLQAIGNEVEVLRKPYLRRVINGTGVILHTNLGRAPLPEEVAQALKENSGYLMLEIDQETGKRGKREHTISDLLAELTGAEAATVVNNNAAATLISLSALAAGREVIVSRGQLVEIGGSYRIPDVMAQSGALLREVGCTNKTHRKDYEEAIGEETALLLEVHTSNYRIMGFSDMVSTEELVDLGKKHDLPVMYDMGSGNLVDLKPFGVLDEPTVQEKMATGIDLATFSGDKLLGGPQAGIIVGKKKYVDRIRKNQLYRAIRPGKLDLLALERVLQIYLYEKNPFQKIPGLKMLATSRGELEKRARKYMDEVKNQLFASHLEIEIQEDPAQIGSGALPTVLLPSVALALKSEEKSAEELAGELRRATPPLFSRIRDGWVLINLKTVFPGERKEVVRLLSQL